MSQMITYGIYQCARCSRPFTVLDAWAACTPDFCHGCLAHITAQLALVPIDEAGKELLQ